MKNKFSARIGDTCDFSPSFDKEKSGTVLERFTYDEGLDGALVLLEEVVFTRNSKTVRYLKWPSVHELHDFLEENPSPVFEFRSGAIVMMAPNSEMEDYESSMQDCAEDFLRLLERGTIDSHIPEFLENYLDDLRGSYRIAPFYTPALEKNLSVLGLECQKVESKHKGQPAMVKVF